MPKGGGRPCSICEHDQRDEIDAALADGEEIRKIAVHWKVSASALRNHRVKHMSQTLVELTAPAGEEQHARVSSLDRLEYLYDRTNQLLAQAELNGATGPAIQAVRELRSTVESIARITGELNDKPTVTVNLAASPEWLQLQQVILAALNPYPTARLAVAQAIESTDSAGVIEP